MQKRIGDFNGGLRRCRPGLQRTRSNTGYLGIGIRYRVAQIFAAKDHSCPVVHFWGNGDGYVGY